MQKYVKDYLKSRKIDPDFDTVVCELCYYGEWKMTQAVDVHHIEQSMRKRTHKPDGSDLIGLCRECHNRIHSRNNKENRDKLLELVAKILQYV